MKTVKSTLPNANAYLWKMMHGISGTVKRFFMNQCGS